ncbi:MAG: GNAT family N-acetyltransferase [Marmoricola sp.]
MDEQPNVTIRPLGRPGDLGWVVMAHGEEYAEEFGWNTDMEALIARIVADYAARDDHQHDELREAAWIAELDGVRVGSVFCVASDDPSVARLRVLLVTRAARGLGLGKRLVRECLDFAERAGYEQVTLWTNDVLASARRIYEEAGFVLVDEERHHSFGQDLTGQNWTLRLEPG